MEKVIKELMASGRCLCVGKDGQVFRKIDSELIPLARHKDKDGYEYVEVTSNGRRSKLLVHRLVATVFHDNPDNLPQVNHIDGNKLNNGADNLEWASNSANQIHSRYVLGNMTGFKDKPVICLDTGEEFISTRDAWRKTGINYSHISECASGKRKTAGGHRWGYLTREANE